MQIQQHYEKLKKGAFSKFWKRREDVYNARFSSNKNLIRFVEWFDKNEIYTGQHYKGACIYFTYEGLKFHLNYVYFERKFMTSALEMLRVLGATNLFINYGEVDN